MQPHLYQLQYTPELARMNNSRKARASRPKGSFCRLGRNSRAVRSTESIQTQVTAVVHLTGRVSNACCVTLKLGIFSELRSPS